MLTISVIYPRDWLVMAGAGIRNGGWHGFQLRDIWRRRSGCDGRRRRWCPQMNNCKRRSRPGEDAQHEKYPATVDVDGPRAGDERWLMQFEAALGAARDVIDRISRN